MTISASDKIAVASWVAWRMYRTATETRCFISNERQRTYLLLTDASAELFEKIACGTSYRKLYQVAEYLDVVEALDGYLAELAREALLSWTDKDRPSDCLTATNTPPDTNIENEMIEWAGKNGFLYSCHLDLTYRCNQKCLHCYNPNALERRSGEPSASDELTTEEITNLFDQLAALGVFRIILSGGEATLRPDLQTILQDARQKGFCVELYSNGLGFCEAFVVNLRALGIHKVSLSLYSHDAQLHDRITGIPGSWVQTVASFALLRKHGIQTACKSIPMTTTIDGYFETKQLGASLADSVSMDMSLSAGYGDNLSPLGLQPTERQMIDVFKKEIEQGTLKKQVALKLDKPPCGAGHKSLCIGPDGSIYPCTGFPYSLGNIRQDKLADIWRGSPADNGFLSRWQQTQIADFDECGSHDYCDYCPEVCAGAAWLATGNYLAANESSCRQARAYQQAIRQSEML